MIWDKFPIDESLKPYLPAAMQYLGIPIQTAETMEYIFDFIMKLKDGGKIKQVGDILTNPDIADLISKFKNDAEYTKQHPGRDIVDVEIVDQGTADIHSFPENSSKIQVVKCRHCGMYNYVKA